MKEYKYTNKEERPIPKYRNGDIAWYIDNWFEHPQRCIIKGCCNVSWFEEMRERRKNFENAIKEENERVKKESDENKINNMNIK